jgi:uncharacterized membrane protein
MMNKLLDLRFIIGLFFTLVGLLLFLYSFFAGDRAGELESVNRWCGIFFILFGTFMNLMAWLQPLNSNKNGNQ